jgi:hypothetical protein
MATKSNNETRNFSFSAIYLRATVKISAIKKGPLKLLTGPGISTIIKK